ncbi:MAG: hypothetical protein WBD12_07160, partial [Candidatus Omnitrophota bacterium]
KVEAAISRQEVRDCFDLEFLLRRGITLAGSKKELLDLKKLALQFKEKDFKVTLGSILEPEVRKYYIDNGFSYLIEKIDGKLA